MTPVNALVQWFRRSAIFRQESVSALAVCESRRKPIKAGTPIFRHFTLHAPIPLHLDASV
jgi:hypothetical protein